MFPKSTERLLLLSHLYKNTKTIFILHDYHSHSLEHFNKTVVLKADIRRAHMGEKKLVTSTATVGELNRRACSNVKRSKRSIKKIKQERFLFSFSFKNQNNGDKNLKKKLNRYNQKQNGNAKMFFPPFLSLLASSFSGRRHILYIKRDKMGSRLWGK